MTKFYPVPFGHIEVRVDRRPLRGHRARGRADEARDLRDTGPLRLEVRVPSGRIDLESVEGDETIVELEGSPEIEEDARIEMRPRRDGHEVIVVDRRAGACSSAFAATFGCACPLRQAPTSRSRRPRPMSTGEASSERWK